MKKIYHCDGEVIFHDPGPEMLRFFSEVDTAYKVQSVQPGPSFIPKFQRLRKTKIRTNRPLFEMTENELMTILNGKTETKSEIEEEYWHSALDILYVLSLKHIKGCRLCGWNCGANRFRETGKCGLDGRAYHNKPFIHIAEEIVINPAIVTNLGGCSLRCLYCIEHKIWDAEKLPLSNPQNFWQYVIKLLNKNLRINTLEFTNPTESLPGLLAILNEAPFDFSLPVILNCHLYGSRFFYELADMVSDVWLLDFRYGNDECAKALSGVENYMKCAKDGLEFIIDRSSRLIVRILVLPGHLNCCHKPILKLLSQYKNKIFVSILDQYVPEHKAHLNQNLKRRPTKEELRMLDEIAKKNGLRNIILKCDDFWKS
jgi:putative pyruvate formate lyase activating enzyme